MIVATTWFFFYFREDCEEGLGVPILYDEGGEGQLTASDKCCSENAMDDGCAACFCCAGDDDCKQRKRRVWVTQSLLYANVCGHVLPFCGIASGLHEGDSWCWCFLFLVSLNSECFSQSQSISLFCDWWWPKQNPRGSYNYPTILCR